MLIIDVKGLKDENEVREALKPAIRSLRDGGILIYPTDTVYGIGCDPRNEEALIKLLTLKGRSGKPLPLLASSIEIVRSIAEVPPKAERLMRVFWPGPLTIVLPLKASLPDQVTMGERKVGLRIPNHVVARILAEGVGGLIVGTSANKSGEPPPRSFDEVDPYLKKMVSVVIDGGTCPLGVPSTVVEVDGEVKVIREGAVKVEEVLRELRDD
ncbi:MAG: L-threonylcarbamoyladenylate synthase [Candidatus Nezhaarchaeota archaeon]|nr:L-threonylcarbamoyladenylate synthase [Candidatus Nezhaarchaeota archaeon]